MATLQIIPPSLFDSRCYLGPFGRYLPVEAGHPQWLQETSPAATPRRRARYPSPELPKRPLTLQFGSDTSLFPEDTDAHGESSHHSTPNPVHSVEGPKVDGPRKRRATGQLPTPTSCYAPSLSAWSSGPSRTASPEDASSACGPPLLHDNIDTPTSDPGFIPKEFPMSYAGPAIAPNDPTSDPSMESYMRDSGSEPSPFPYMDFDFGNFDGTGLEMFSPGTIERASVHYHQSRLPFIPDLASGQVALPTSADITNEQHSFQLAPTSVPEQKYLAHVVEERVIEGEGLCYIYSDGSHCPKYRNGELVNANWGITKAGKPRKRLAQACLTCRSKKIKCIPNFPKCDQCRRSGRNCRYENAVRRNSSKAANRPSLSRQHPNDGLMSPIDLPDTGYMATAESLSNDFLGSRSQDMMSSPASYPDQALYA